jgi:YD repeat-containing protein
MCLKITSTDKQNLYLQLAESAASSMVPTSTSTYTYDAADKKIGKIAIINSVTTNTDYIRMAWNDSCRGVIEDL